LLSAETLTSPKTARRSTVFGRLAATAAGPTMSCTEFAARTIEVRQARCNEEAAVAGAKRKREEAERKRLRPDAEEATRSSLLADVKRFEKASLVGEYFGSFDINSKNCTQQSIGTSAWIAEYRRLLDHCVRDARKGDPTEVRQAMDILFGLLDHIDECHDDVIFFADEGGWWQVGTDWAKVLPAWFKVLSTTAGPEGFAGRMTALLSKHYRYGRDKMLASARRTAAPAQRKALAEAEGGPRETGRSA